LELREKTLKIWAFSFTLLFAGCAPKPDHLVLRYSAWGSPEASNIFKAAADEFRKTHPEVEVQMQQVPYDNYVPKLLTQFAANSAPDVMLVSCNQLAAFATRGVFADLRPYVSKDSSLNLHDFYPEAIQEFTVEGALTALPTYIAPIGVIYYNKKEFNEARIPYPKNSWSYLDFLKTAQRLTKKDSTGKTVQYGFLDQWIMLETWIFTFGGNLVDDPRHPIRCVEDSPAAVAGAQFRADLTLKYGVTPGPAYMTAMGGVIGNSDFFVNGTVAMFHSGIWEVPFFRKTIQNFDWDVVEFPKGPHGRRAIVMDAAGYGISKSCKRPDLAYELVRCLAGESGQKTLAASGLSMPALRPLAKSKFFLDGQKPLSKGFLVDSVKDGRFMAMEPHFVEWRNLILSYLDRVWSGQEPAESALKKAVAEVNRKFFNKP
jgi:ABC-type glycerol-3-phosphate transport system substrate-binding protein